MHRRRKTIGNQAIISYCKINFKNTSGSNFSDLLSSKQVTGNKELESIMPNFPDLLYANIFGGKEPFSLF